MNTLSDLRRELARIAPAEKAYAPAARAHLDDLTKPVGSLGRLEDLAVQLYCIAKGQEHLSVDPVCLFTIAGDHGVTRRGVTANPPEVTRQMVQNFLNGGAGVNALCRCAHIEHLVVDAGCFGEAFPKHHRLLQRRIGSGTADMTTGPAMSLQDCARAVAMGMDLAETAVARGIRCLAIGEMGIGNTTAASALFAALLGLSVPDVTGPGAGLGSGGLSFKIRLIEQALTTHAATIAGGDALAMLAALGGYEIAAMAGVILGAAKMSVPCLVDGFIAQSAFTAAWKACPAVAGYAIFAHTSAEPGSAVLLVALDRKPLLDLGMRLGEGTGCALAVPLLRGACAIFNEMSTFGGAGVTKAEPSGLVG